MCVWGGGEGDQQDWRYSISYKEHKENTVYQLIWCLVVTDVANLVYNGMGTYMYMNNFMWKEIFL